jgi:plastocyanin domain-containing protein
MLLTTIRKALRADAPASAGELHVHVRGGYSPAVLHARAGEPVRISFFRDETAACSERVVFPDFGKSAMLPRGEIVTVELPSAEPGTYEFTCAMNMLHGTLILEPLEEGSR